MKTSRFTAWIAAFLLAWATLALAAGPDAKVPDTSTPPTIDGNLADWTTPPAFLLNAKEQVVEGVAAWKGPETSSAKVRLTYDAKFLYIGAEILSQNPQCNAQRDGEIYNGDCLELYIGTDLSDKTRVSYALTDMQIGLSPGNKGEKPQVYSFTDKADIPGAKIATTLIAGGYTLEAAIPLAFFYKLDVGPGKSIGFDVGLDDTGAGNATRTLQVHWSGSSKGWQDPSVWGTLTFTGKTAFVNTAPKMNSSEIQIKETNPEAGRKKASTQGVLLWGFNGDQGGFDGKVTAETKVVSEGAGALSVDIDGSAGWNQGLAASETVPKADQWENFKALSMEVYLAPGALAGVSYAEILLVTGSPANSFYQSFKFKMQEGWNFIKQNVDATQFKGGVQKVYLVVNSGGPMHGRMVVDNIRGILKGASGALVGRVVDETGQPVADALVAVNKTGVPTLKDGTFRVALPEENYPVEILKPGFEIKTDKVKIEAGKDTSWPVTLGLVKTTVQPVTVKTDFSKTLRLFDPHSMYGINIASWYEKEWFPDSVIPRIQTVFDFVRVPGGGFTNRWMWKTGQLLRKDGVTPDWAPPLKWENMAGFIHKLGPNAEALMTLNIMTDSVQSGLDWIADTRARGLKVKYVELGNEPDYEPNLVYQGKTAYWTVIDNYCLHYLEFAKAIRAKYPDIQLVGPCVAQLGNRQRAEGSPWLAGDDAPWWDGEFLKKCAPYVDVISLHTYPYWSNNSEANLMTKTSVVSDYMPRLRKAIAEYAPGRKIEISVTEWNSGDENAMTAKTANGIFAADFMGHMLVSGVDSAMIWDLFTQKPGMGGGHGVLDATGDPTRPFSERSSYWALYMYRHYFGDTLTEASTGQSLISAYASTKGNVKYLMVVNKSADTVYQAQVEIGPGAHQLELYKWGATEYQWSENLYRAVVNKGPQSQKSNTSVTGSFHYKFQPYSITCFKLTPVAP